ncbi:SDR family NAD(P)-dependent oxidoreductase [Sphingoaurantiacus capsulatus]|uniref:SDR family NAD(P)-dependent oxidoreductase n=1 Tax=Sphingoaurantiacus capsulatus TaxID=1771310 RepID=A0ABV7X893_9SPHN
MPPQPLAGRVALVAGASRSLERGIAIEVGAAGAFVYLLGRTLSPGSGTGSLVETLEQVEALGGRGATIACDCRDDDALAASLAHVRRTHGRLDILVNSVFAASRFAASIGKRFWETPTTLWEEVVDLGVRSAYLASCRAAPLLIETAQRTGQPTAIFNISGRGAARYRYNVAYGVGKAATDRLTRDTAIDLRESNVAVISLWPNGAAANPERPETPRYTGRAVAALAADPVIMDRSGQPFWSAQIGADYGFTDEAGHPHEVPVLEDYLGRP